MNVLIIVMVNSSSHNVEMLSVLCPFVKKASEMMTMNTKYSLIKYHC